MKVYLVAQARFKQLMRIYLAESGGIWEAYFSEKDFAHAYILQSFYYADEFTEKHIIPNAKDFLLDSGAFTFMQGKGHTDWNEYLERYADFINRNRIKHFFELDIDSVVGYEEVKRLRRNLERLTGRQPIPVWHNNRGKDEFERHAKEYPYVAIGGLVAVGKAEYARKLWKFFPWFINTAHENGAKIHALGFTSLDGITQYHFDSVDSTAWTTGNRFGFVYKFDGRTMKKIDVPEGYRLNNPKKVALINYTEWIKFQKYAETHL